MPTLSQRLASLRARQQAAAPSAQVFTFGKHKGKSFAEIWDSDPSYVKWTAEHISDGSGANQSAWLRYVERRISQDEAIVTAAENRAEATTDSSTETAIAGAVAVITRMYEKRLASVESLVFQLEQRLSAVESP